MWHVLLMLDGLVCVSQKLLIYWEIAISGVYREWCEKDKISNELQFSG